MTTIVVDEGDVLRVAARIQAALADGEPHGLSELFTAARECFDPDDWLAANEALWLVLAHHLQVTPARDGRVFSLDVDRPSEHHFRYVSVIRD